MQPLTIELAKGTKARFHSIGWKVPRPNDCRRQFFALTPDGNASVVTLKAAIPDFYDPLRQARAVLSCEPFPEAVCIEVSPCQLLPPLCYESREDRDSQVGCYASFEPWKFIFRQTHPLNLTLTPDDNAPLQERLDKWLAVVRRAYERESAYWRAEIEKVKAAPLEKLGLGTEEQRADRLKELGEQLAIVESDNPIEGVPCKGHLKLTLADVKRGHEGIRDAYMHEFWAAQNGEDLSLMRSERQGFRTWLNTHTGTPSNVFDSKLRQTRLEIASPRFGQKFENDPRFLEACALVRYRARFADNAGSVVYLNDCELRSELSADERAEVATLANPSLSAAPPPWHTEGFTSILRRNTMGEQVESLPLSNEFRALCLLLSERQDCTAQFSELEPKIGALTHQLDTAAEVAKPSTKGPRRVRDMLRIQTGRKLLKWGVLVVVAGGREKFLKLCPPTPTK